MLTTPERLPETSVGRAVPTGWVVVAVAWLVLGVAAALAIVYGLGLMHGADNALAGTTVLTPASSVGAASLCYLAAAATGRRAMAWVALPFAAGLPFLGLVSGIPWWAIVTAVGVVVALAGAYREGGSTLAQTVAMVAYFGLAVVSLLLAPAAGLALAGAALAAHAGWDLWHLRADVVVPESFAVWCCGLDLTAGGLCLALALLT